MKTPDVDAGRLERRVRRVGSETTPGCSGFCSFYSSGAIRGVSLLRLTALFWINFKFAIFENHPYSFSFMLN